MINVIERGAISLQICNNCLILGMVWFENKFGMIADILQISKDKVSHEKFKIFKKSGNLTEELEKRVFSW